jgi:hypothetical protein
MNTANQESLETGVISYIDNWINHGAPPQKYEVFSKLTWPMPAPCIELWCLSKEGNDWYLWCTQRGPEDQDYAYCWHNIGSAAMLSDFVGPESEFLIERAPFLSKVFEKAKEDISRYNLTSPKERIVQRILRKDSGMKDETFILSLLNKPVSVGSYYDLTPRGAEVIESLILEATDMKDKFSGGKWIKVDDIPGLIKEHKFVAHQWPRLQKALENWMNIK